VGPASRGIGRQPRGAKRDGTDGTYGANAIYLWIDTEVAGGTLIRLLAPELITDPLITDYQTRASRLLPTHRPATLQRRDRRRRNRSPITIHLPCPPFPEKLF
jgi:hypothetical protein